MSYTIRPGLNTDPVYDGDFGWYQADDAGSVLGWENRAVLYVNGMNVLRKSASADSLMLSSAIKGRCLGLYNERGTLFGITWETLRQRLKNSYFFLSSSISVEVTQTVTQVTNVNTGNNTVNGMLHAVGGVVNQVVNSVTQTVTQELSPADAILQVLESKSQQLSTLFTFSPDIVQCAMDYRRCIEFLAADKFIGVWIRQNPQWALEFARIYFADNPVIVKLIEFLTDNVWPMTKFLAFCHSQGNLIMSSALIAFHAIRGLPSPRSTVVFAVASPAPVWPQGITVRFYSDPADLVPELSLGTSYKWGTNISNSHKGFPDNHAISSYAANTPLMQDLAREAGISPASGAVANPLHLDRFRIRP